MDNIYTAMDSSMPMATKDEVFTRQQTIKYSTSNKRSSIYTATNNKVD